MCGEVCGKCHGGMMLVIGIVILVVAIQWPRNIWHVLGVLLILKGIIVLSKPDGCGHVTVPTTPAKAVKGKKRR